MCGLRDILLNRPVLQWTKQCTCGKWVSLGGCTHVNWTRRLEADSEHNTAHQYCLRHTICSKVHFHTRWIQIQVMIYLEYISLICLKFSRVRTTSSCILQSYDFLTFFHVSLVWSRSPQKNIYSGHCGKIVSSNLTSLLVVCEASVLPLSLQRH